MLNGVDHGPKYDVTFTRDRPVFEPIVEVRPVPSVPVRCIEVDAVDGMYLAGRSFIPTHNSSLGRLGLLIHSTAGFVDAGFDGHITLELANVASLPITLYPGMKIGQISFMEMTTPADAPYGLGRHRLEVPGPARPHAEPLLRELPRVARPRAGKGRGVPRLRHVSPDSPGWARRRRGKGFVYLDHHGQPLGPDERARCIALVIPPAWEDVWICPAPNGHIQALGTDAAGRRQYLYHPVWREQRDKAKHDRVLTVAARLPQARTIVGEHLELPGMPRERALGHGVPAARPRILPRRRRDRTPRTTAATGWPRSRSVTSG